MLGLENRLIGTQKELENNMWLLDEFDYKQVNYVLSNKKAESLTWLKNALESPKRKITSSYDVLIKENQKLKEELFVLRNDINELKVSDE